MALLNSPLFRTSEIFRPQNWQGADDQWPRFRGELAPWISNLTELTWLAIPFNYGTGTIPTEVGLLTKLKVLDLGGNRFQGSLPTELGRLTALTQLFLNNNQYLTGIIPSQLANLNLLQLLDVANNSLSGPIPTDLIQLPKLTGLHIEDNLFTGPIPQLSSQSRKDSTFSRNCFDGTFGSDRSERCPASPSPSPTMVLSAGSDNSLPIGAIVGGIIGGLVFLALLVLAFCLCRKTRKSQESIHVPHEDSNSKLEQQFALPPKYHQGLRNITPEDASSSVRLLKEADSLETSSSTPASGATANSNTATADKKEVQNPIHVHFLNDVLGPPMGPEPPLPDHPAYQHPADDANMNLRIFKVFESDPTYSGSKVTQPSFVTVAQSDEVASHEIEVSHADSEGSHILAGNAASLISAAIEPETWTVEQTAEWVEGLGRISSNVALRIREQGINGHILLRLGRDDLREELGLAISERILFEREVARLKARGQAA
ncbi:hypothetical protein BC830DRAFT_1110719 [Chytriomyces sp. MP71]|nr:hypothetical protein BC830DRAFT_1110719 [Chytriomyces sp. MP71]